MTDLDAVSLHTLRITHLLEQPNINQVAQRLYRTRYHVGGEFVVASIVQRFSQPDFVPTAVSILVTRGFQRAELHLTGKYSMDEIVAFLRLDLVDFESMHDWVDETPTKIIVASGVDTILEKFKS